MSKINLLEETLKVLKDNGKNEKDVKWVGSREIKTSWRNFKEIANFEYDNGYGAQRVISDLIVVGTDFWLSREEYDGAEWWRYNTFPEEPNVTKRLNFLSAYQALDSDIEFYSCEASLKNINEI